MFSQEGEETSAPLPARIRLSHAYFQRLANLNAIDLLHVKGYAFGEEVYRPGRYSTDVDLLARPAHISRFLYLLEQEGWRSLTSFKSGSIFEHATTLYHPSWGLTDIHLYFPGLSLKNHEAAFSRLWDQKRTKEVAHFSCFVPSLVDCRNIVVIHGARSSAQVHPDVQYLQEQLSRAEWDEMRRRIIEFDAEIAFDAALGQVERHSSHPDYLVWKTMQNTQVTPLQWWARIKRAEGIRSKLRIIMQIIFVNEDHLAMQLGHKPSAQEIRESFFKRFERISWWRKNK